MTKRHPLFDDQFLYYFLHFPDPLPILTVPRSPGWITLKNASDYQANGLTTTNPNPNPNP